MAVDDLDVAAARAGSCASEANGSSGHASRRPSTADERRHLGLARAPARTRSAGGRRSRPDGAAARRRLPAIATSSAPPSASGCGSASSSARVYGWRGCDSSSSTLPASTMRPGVEHRDPVGDRRHHAEVVRDQDHGEPALSSQPVEQAQDAGLHGHVERGRRLVGDQELRSAGEGDRDRDPLPHAAGELVREALERLLRIGDAHLVEQLERARGRPLPAEGPRAGARARSAACRSRASGAAR